MRFYWIRDRVRQGQFCIYWKKGILNKADYFTKHHPPQHHQAIRSVYLHNAAADAASRNYFECLQDDEDDPPSPPRSVHFQDSDSGEGVLISREPGPGTQGASNPETDVIREAPGLSNANHGSPTGIASSPGSPNGIA
jgi:hypothetical protein